MNDRQSAPQHLDWRKSRASGTGDCVEVAVHNGQILVRDSKSPHSGYLSFTPTEWRAFLRGAVNGEFDLLAEVPALTLAPRPHP